MGNPYRRVAMKARDRFDIAVDNLYELSD